MNNIECVIDSLKQREQWKRNKLPGEQRLRSSIKDGKPMSLVAMNCIKFNYTEHWTYDEGYTYPLATPLLGAPSIVNFYGEDVLSTWRMLQSIGDTSLSIIVPDSELTERRAFNYDHLSSEVLQRIGQQLQIETGRVLDRLVSQGANVELWSDYCKRNNLPDPTGMTSRMITEIEAERAKVDPTLSNNQKEKRYPLTFAVERQLESTRKYLAGMNLEPDYIETLTDDKIRERVTAYCAMYAGEGATLASDEQTTRILFNAEDGRVPAWYQRGAGIINKELVITTPVDPRRFSENKHDFYTGSK